MEGFVPIPLFEGYFINTEGQVFSNYSQRIIRMRQDRRGYILAPIKRDGRMYTVGRYRLKALAFIGVPAEMEINHINGVKWDDRIENLEWVTRSENTLHAIRTGLFVLKNGNIGKALYYKEPKAVLQIKDGVVINEYGSTLKAMKATGFKRQAIGACARGKLKHAYGYQWEYKTPA